MRIVIHKCPYCGKTNIVYVDETEGMYECAACLHDVDTRTGKRINRTCCGPRHRHVNS